SGRTFAGFLAALALGAPPLTGAAAGALVRGAGGVATEVGIDNDFIGEVENLMKPGTSALFVLDLEGDMGAIVEGIRGPGGTVLKTNVDVHRARVIQTTLAAPQTQTEGRSCLPPRTCGPSDTTTWRGPTRAATRLSNSGGVPARPGST